MAKVIKSTGPVPARCMVIGERGGKEEAYRGVVFCGPSGQELDRHLLVYSGLARDSVHCRNVVIDYRNGENPEEYEVQRDWPLTVEAIQAVRPQFVMAQGLWAARAFLGHDFDMDWGNSLHFPIKWNCHSFVLMPVIHVAAGMHQPKYAAQIAHGFRQFGKLVRGEALPVGHLTAQPPCHYSDGILSIAGVDTIAMDTEGDTAHPWGLSYSVRLGQASVQHGRRHRQWNCKALRDATIVMHGAMHDLPVLERLGVRPAKWECTLLKAALLGTEPHSLKALARRHAGMRMRTYEDIVRKAEREIALSYLSRVIDWAHEHEEV